VSRQYVTIESKEEVNIPPWSTTWPGYDGCSPRGPVYHTGRSRVAPTSQVNWYADNVVELHKSATKLRGRLPRGFMVPYAMTPYEVTKIQKRSFLLRRRDCDVGGIDVYEQYGNVHKVGAACNVFADPNPPHSGPVAAKWINVTSEHPGTEYVLNGFSDQDVSDAVTAVMNDASIEALTSYDILTDAAEARELPQLVRSVSEDLFKIFRAFMGHFKPSDLRKAALLNPMSLLKNPTKILKELGQRWMEYRYGIMPLVYSYRDAMKTLKRGVDVTTRKSRVIRPRDLGVTLPGPTNIYRWSVYSGSIQVRATVFQNFDWSTASRLAGLGINPLVTAWELIPYSFVADWFVNIGDYIIRKTTSPNARWLQACVSIKKDTTKKTYAHFRNEDKTINFSNVLPTLWWGSAPTTPASQTCSRPEENQLLYEEVVQSYVRSMFNPSDVRLNFNPNLNWRRLIDSAAMSLNRLGSLVRAFR